MEERRQLPRLTPDEIADIAAAIIKAQGTPVPHVCRLSRVKEEDIESVIRIHHDVSDEDLREAVKFFKNFNRAMNETGRTLRNLIVTLGVGAVVGLLVVGLWAEIRNKLGL